MSRVPQRPNTDPMHTLVLVHFLIVFFADAVVVFVVVVAGGVEGV